MSRPVICVIASLPAAATTRVLIHPDPLRLLSREGGPLLSREGGPTPAAFPPRCDTRTARSAPRRLGRTLPRALSLPSQVLLLRPAVSHSLASWCARSAFLGACTRGGHKRPWQGLWTLGCSFLSLACPRGRTFVLLEFSEGKRRTGFTLLIPIPRRPKLARGPRDGGCE